MSGKLDKSLDEILSTQRRTAGRRRSVRRPSGQPAKAAPVGGISKSSKPARGNAAKPAPTKGARSIGESKVVVSNLPRDVSETQIKEYFGSTVGQVKRVELSYGPNSQSRGIATVVFSHSDGASKAFSELNGLLIDNRPVKVEVVVSSADQIPQPKSLGQRVSQPKAQPKSAATDKQAAKGTKGPAGTKGGAKKARGGRSARPAKKTAEELDSEMADYFNANSNTEAPTNGTAAAAAAAGDASMEDEIL